MVFSAAAQTDQNTLVFRRLTSTSQDLADGSPLRPSVSPRANPALQPFAKISPCFVFFPEHHYLKLSCLLAYLCKVWAPLSSRSVSSLKCGTRLSCFLLYSQPLGGLAYRKCLISICSVNEWWLPGSFSWERFRCNYYYRYYYSYLLSLKDASSSIASTFHFSLI